MTEASGVVFDTCAAGYRYWWFPMAGILVGILSFAIDHALGNSPFRRPRPRSAKWTYGFVAAWTLLTAGITVYDYVNVCGSLRAGRFVVVEGVVHNFVPMPKGGHAKESFVVSGHRYEYSDFAVQAGFNNTQSHGGPIREGLRIRVHDVGGTIARLEVLR